MENKSLTLPEAIMKTADKCHRKFACLTDPSGCCKPKFQLTKDRILFVDFPRSAECAYSRPWGYSYVCNCPARKELFSRFRK
jgi:hypothetical protein